VASALVWVNFRVERDCWSPRFSVFRSLKAVLQRSTNPNLPQDQSTRIASLPVLAACVLLAWQACGCTRALALGPVPDRLVVLTVDDSVKSQFTVARPILKKLQCTITTTQSSPCAICAGLLIPRTFRMIRGRSSISADELVRYSSAKNASFRGVDLKAGQFSSGIAQRTAPQSTVHEVIAGSPLTANRWAGLHGNRPPT
jgi:hypothetical protein